MTGDAFGPGTKDLALHALRRNGLTIHDAPNRTDDELLALGGFGKKCLRWVRAQNPSDWPETPADLDVVRARGRPRGEGEG